MKSISRFTASLDRWHMLTTEMLHPSFEATPEEFAPILRAFRDAQADGHAFDPGVCSLMTMLERQAIGSDDDTDCDVSVDDGQEFDDPHEGMECEIELAGESDELDDEGAQPDRWPVAKLNHRRRDKAPIAGTYINLADIGFDALVSHIDTGRGAA